MAYHKCVETYLTNCDQMFAKCFHFFPTKPFQFHFIRSIGPVGPSGPIRKVQVNRIREQPEGKSVLDPAEASNLHRRLRVAHPLHREGVPNLSGIYWPGQTHDARGGSNLTLSTELLLTNFGIDSQNSHRF